MRAIPELNRKLPYRIECGMATPPNANGYIRMQDIVFKKAFSNPPIVIGSVRKGSESRDPWITVGTYKVTTSGFIISVQSPNGDIGSTQYTVDWIAIGN